MLTVATSVASGCDAIFSSLPQLAGAKVEAELFVIAGLMTLNLRGVRESVKALMPIFVAFVVTHVVLILWGIFSHGPAFGHLVADTVADTHSAIGEVGLLGVLVISLRAFSLGGGTFTGIEAVSNGMPILREPRVKTARHTMLLHVASLSFTAGGILLCYLLHDVHHQPGLTLNATLWTLLTQGWRVGRRSRARDRRDHAAVRGHAAVRRGADRLHRRPAHAHASWRWTAGCRAASRTSPSGSSPRTACC